MRYVTSNKIREIDRLAQERFSIPSIILMENAGIAATEEIIKHFSTKEVASRKIAVFCGKGNNGGDGFVVARHLKCIGKDPVVFLLGKASDIKGGDPRTNLKPLKKIGVKIIELPDVKSVKRAMRKFSCEVIVDGIFGTGFSGSLPVHIAHLINFLNRSELPIFSIDVPSGLDATTGKVYDTCIKATVTITFGLQKTGFVKSDGPQYTGKVITRNISYPQSLLR